MKIVLILALAISIYAADTCYTVQLVSKYNSKKNITLLDKMDYPQNCKLMEIGKSLTVRCGCYEKYIQADESLVNLKQKYRQAVVSTTYKYRFDETPKEEQAQEIVEAAEQEVKQNKVIVIVPIVQDTKSEELVLVKDITAVDETPIVFNKPTQANKVKKSKKKKKSKNKFIKKRDARYVYTPYINMLKNNKGIGPFDYRYKFGAQISYDVGIVSEVDPLYSIRETHYTQNDWRRVRVTHKGSFFDKKLFYEMEYSFTGNNQYKDMFIGYTDKIDALNSRYRLKAGNIKIPFSLEAYTSSKYITFMERALSDAYADGRKMGGELLLSTKLDKNRINIFAAGFSNSIDERIDNDVEQPGYSLRGTYAYKFSKRHLISLGGAIMNQDMKGENVRFNQSSESEFAKNKYVSVKIKDVDMMKKSNIEALYINKKFSLQGEYTTVVTEALENDYTFDAYYLQGSYFLLGKGRRYKLSTSTLGKIRPNKDGALELAFRYSYIDLNDKDEHGGTQTDYNYALNWYYSPELKFMVNYVVAEPSGTDD